MSFKAYDVGLEVTEAKNNGQLQPISRVTLIVDDEVSFTTGDDTGHHVQATCPYATQEMVDAILAEVAGFQYQMMSAEAVEIDPAFELGDAIRADGVTSVVAKIYDDGNGYPNISAPGETEDEEEFCFEGPLSQEIKQQNKKTRSLIAKTASEIRLEIQNEIDGLSSSFTVELGEITARIDGLDEDFIEVKATVDGLTVTDDEGTTRIKGSSIETDTLYVKAANVTGTLTAAQLNITGSITWSDLASEVHTNINNAGMAESEVSTLITSTLVSSPNIAGGKFKDLSQTNWIEMGAGASGSVGYLNHYYSGYSSGSPVLVMGYANQSGSHNWILAPFFSVALNYLLSNNTMYAMGNWDFSQATVTGLS